MKEEWGKDGDDLGNHRFWLEVDGICCIFAFSKKYFKIPPKLDINNVFTSLTIG